MDFFDTILNGLIDILSVFISLLPDSPFRKYLSFAEISVSGHSFDELLGYLNYFIPFGTCVSIFELWLVAVIAYYAYDIIVNTTKSMLP